MSAGIKANLDGSGAIQVGGTDYITISSSGAVAIPVSLTVGGIPAGGNYDLNVYTSPATWDATAAKAAGLKAIKVTVVGAGGASSAITASAASSGGGGGGGAAIEYVPVANITPGTKTVTAGSGTNSFGPWGTATPNSPTATTSATAGSAASTITAGAGGVGAGGSINIGGQGGGSGASPASNVGGTGGSSILGGGGAAGSAPGVAGGAGQNYGGGGGGPGGTPTTTTRPAVAGAPGVVIIEEFY